MPRRGAELGDEQTTTRRGANNNAEQKQKRNAMRFLLARAAATR